MWKDIQTITLMVVIFFGIISVITAWISLDQTSKSSQDLLEGNAAMLEEIRKSNTNDAALIEKAFWDFQPELEYRISDISVESREPYSMRTEITNMGSESTFVKNIWTVTGEICNPDGTSRDFDYDYSFRKNIVLEKDKRQSIDFTIPEEFFEKFPDKTAFILRLELEMNPYLPTTGPVETREFDEMAFIQYDFDKERDRWMPKNLHSRDIDCTSISSEHGQVFLNTTSWDFGEYGQWWKFPEE